MVRAAGWWRGGWGRGESGARRARRLTTPPPPLPLTHTALARARAEDTFNLYGLKTIIPDFRACLDLILSGPSSSTLEGLADPHYADAKDLYGLIHARYILSARGLTLMVRRARGRRARARAR